MNVPTIEFLSCDRFPYRHPVSTYAPPWTRLPAVPKHPFKNMFEFTDEGDAPQYGPMVPPMISNPRRLHAKTLISQREEDWRNLVPLFKTPIAQQGFVAPMNSLKGVDHLLGRVAAIERLATHQAREAATDRLLVESDKELPFIVDEFRANGFQAVSLSSSQEDDARDPSELNEVSIFHVPTVYGAAALDIIQAAPILRRIEWERWTMMSGLPMKVTLVSTENGGVAAHSTDRRLSKTERDALGLKIGRASGLTTADKLEDNRAWATLNGAVGSILYGVTTGIQYPEQDMDDRGAEDEYPQEEVLQGPQELGLHNKSQRGEVLSEPSEQTLERWADIPLLILAKKREKK